ncbi:MAG: flavin reductase family protein [Maritimibacter sp.]|jgi:flavin reductase (DIM6/NTAB) family NADH-FMN oxidoreductase RutF
MQQSFTPGPDNNRALRAAFGRFATGVTVVTTAGETGPIGITANSFTSVSLDPPLILWSPAKASRRHDTFIAAEHFALHVMGTDQDAITWGFANSAEAFEHCDWEMSDQGVPLIAGCPARFECSIRDRIDAGDHTVIIAHVNHVTTEDGGDPRVFLGGDYGHFTATD